MECATNVMMMICRVLAVWSKDPRSPWTDDEHRFRQPQGEPETKHLRQVSAWIYQHQRST